MEPILFRCQSCGKELRTPAAMAGVSVWCPCGTRVLVPRPIAISRNSGTGITAISAVVLAAGIVGLYHFCTMDTTVVVGVSRQGLELVNNLDLVRKQQIGVIISSIAAGCGFLGVLFGFTR